MGQRITCVLRRTTREEQTVTFDLTDSQLDSTQFSLYDYARAADRQAWRVVERYVKSDVMTRSNLPE